MLEPSILGGNQSIKPSEISKLTRQLAMLLKAGIPIRKSSRYFSLIVMKKRQLSK